MSSPLYYDKYSEWKFSEQALPEGEGFITLICWNTDPSLDRAGRQYGEIFEKVLLTEAGAESPLGLAEVMERLQRATSS